jgi:hypothetical protein
MKAKLTPGNIRTLEEAHLAEGKLALLVPTYGVYLNTTGSNRYVPEAEMGEVTEGNFLICTKLPTVPDDDNFVGQHGEFHSVDAILDLIARAPSADQAISQLMAITRPGIQQGQVNAKLMSLPGVHEAFMKAVSEAWDKVERTPTR